MAVKTTREEKNHNQLLRKVAENGEEAEKSEQIPTITRSSKSENFIHGKDLKGQKKKKFCANKRSRCRRRLPGVVNLLTALPTVGRWYGLYCWMRYCIPATRLLSRSLFALWFVIEWKQRYLEYFMISDVFLWF